MLEELRDTKRYRVRARYFGLWGRGLLNLCLGWGGDSGGQVVEVRKGIANLRAFPMRDWLTFVLVKNVKILF